MIWQEMIRALQHSPGDALLLISHASYLLRTGGIFWAVDPRLSGEMHRQADDTLCRDLKGLQVAMITHLHADHYDQALIERLAPLDIHWLFPGFMPDALKAKWRERLPRCSFLAPGDEISLAGLGIRAFESIHYDYFRGERCGVEEIGYRVTAGGKTFLFPGDVRDYDRLPDLQKNADEFFAHVWLGREAALAPDPGMIRAYCRYLAASGAGRIWLAHLNDHDRTDADRWTERHARMILEGIAQLSPGMTVNIPPHGSVLPLG